MVYSVSRMVRCLLRTVLWTRVVSRTSDVMKAEAAGGLDLMAVCCAALTVVRTVGQQAVRMASGAARGASLVVAHWVWWMVGEMDVGWARAMVLFGVGPRAGLLVKEVTHEAAA